VNYLPPAEAAADPLPRAPSDLRWYQRAAMVAGGTLLLSLLATAAILKPNPDGKGTHRQLGLPPCSLVVLAGIRCPSCGMTTSWSHLMRGNVLASVRANSGGTLFALAALASGPWLLVSGLAGRWRGWRPDERVVLLLGLSIIAVTILDWCFRLKLGI
jgi:hypothetical protein